MREHPEAKLPRNVAAIATLTGCSKNQISTYLYRQRRDVKRNLARLPKLDSIPLPLEAEDGTVIVSSECDSVTVFMDKWTTKVVLYAKVKDREFTIPVPNVTDFVNAALAIRDKVRRVETELRRNDSLDRSNPEPS